MAFYFERDIASTVGGDLVVASNGDLKLDTTENSYRALIKFIMSTDNNEYLPDRKLGANLGSLIGRTDLDRVLKIIPTLVRDSMERDGSYRLEDLDIRAIPISVEEILIYVIQLGVYLDENGDILREVPAALTFLFPYKSDGIKEVTLQ